MSRIAYCGVAAALATTGLAAPAAAAPVLQTDRQCYNPGQGLLLTGSGFTPAGQVGLAFSLHGTFGNNAFAVDRLFSADANGGVGIAGPAPDLASPDDTQEDLTITATDKAQQPDPNTPNPAAVATAQVKLSTWDVSVSQWAQHIGVPGRRVKVYADGWEPMTTLWAHYMRGSRTVANVRIGALSGPCGDLTRIIREFPFRPVPAGRYTIYFSGYRTFSKRDAWIRFPRVVVSQRKAID